MAILAKSRSTIDEGACSPDENKDATPHILVLVLLLVCCVEEIVDEEFGESRTSKLNHISDQFFSGFPEYGGQLT